MSFISSVSLLPLAQLRSAYLIVSALQTTPMHLLNCEALRGHFPNISAPPVIFTTTTYNKTMVYVPTLRQMLFLPPDMKGEYSFCIGFSGFTIRFVVPTSVNLPQCFTELMCEDVEEPTAEYRVCLISAPLCPDSEPVSKEGDAYIYVNDKGCLRIYSALTADDGCQVACLLSKNGKNILYYPAKMWYYYRQYWHCTHLLCGELFLMWQDAFLLHSSVVAVNGKAVLFSGPSNAGKSTQAALWAEHADADIINGDRCVIARKDGTFFGGGSPWSGTSDIFRSGQYPIAGIFILGKSHENRLRKLNAEAFASLYSQTTVNSWDAEFVDKAFGFYSELLTKVPVYELVCRPDKDAVMLAYNALFGKESLL